MARVGWSVGARADLREIRAWIARDSRRYAAQTEARIRAAVRRLRDFPESGRVLPEMPEGPFRELIVDSYRVVYRYRPAEGVVAIITVIHGVRRLPTLPRDA